MAKEKETKEGTEELTFFCKFCGESKPVSEMTFMTQYYPILVACHSCDAALQSLKMEEAVAEEPDEEVYEESDEEVTADTAE
ncbi:MAG: hypothetical protein JW967_07895 [Dehalococcoidales bacterium]|nr:hypothetical protein [Dehalococcoidales bacterium]